MRYGHEETVSAGFDPSLRDCWICLRNNDLVNRAREVYYCETMSPAEAAEFRSWLAKRNDRELQGVYCEQIQQCRFDRPEPPTPKKIQQLVQVWRELWRRRLGKP